MRLGDPDESGRPRPVPVPGQGAEVQIACDLLLLALGESADLSLLPESDATGVEPCRVGASACPVFTAGDLCDGAGTVAAAVGSGRRAALAVHAALTGAASPPGSASDGETGDEGLAGPDAVRPRAFTPQARRPVDELPARLRRRSFAEVRRGLAASPGSDPVREEASRCFACGSCTGCDLCVAYCPEGVLRRAESRLPEADLDYCKGCSLCAVTCPRGVLSTKAV
jgi:Pyruvate/2-oxoacid:ferredoxin oxidoreductase delta subunit